MGRQARRKRERPQPAAPPGHPPAAAGRGLVGWGLLVFAVAVIPYLNALLNGFVLDDQLIETDPRMRVLRLGTIFTTGYWNMASPSLSDVYRPMTILSYALTYALMGLNPLAFHGVNIVLHALASVLVLLFLVALLGDRTVGLIAALLFAAHPLHTEAVTSVVGRAEVQATMFLLLALYLHVRGYQMPALRPRVALALALVSFGLGLFSKETVLVGPALVLLVGAMDQREDGLRRAVPVAALYVLVLAVYLQARTAVLGTTAVTTKHSIPGLLTGEPLSVRLLTDLDLLRRYLQLLAWPVSLSADYSYNQIPLSRTLGAGPLAGLACALGLAGGFAWGAHRHHRPLILAIGFFALTHAVIGNPLVPIGVLLAERLMYLPSLGFCLALAWVGVTAASRLRAPRTMTAVLATVLVLYAGRTWRRNADWLDRETLYAATVTVSPNSVTARYRYGKELLHAGKLEAARDQLERALAIGPHYVAAAVDLVTAHLRLDDAQRALSVARGELAYNPAHSQLRALAHEAERRIARQASERPAGQSSER